jgi:hypothetical protein
MAEFQWTEILRGAWTVEIVSFFKMWAISQFLMRNKGIHEKSQV